MLRTIGYILIVSTLSICGCGKMQPQAAAKPPRAETAGTSTASAAPKPVAFDIQGMRIGDKLTDEFAYSHCPAQDKGKAEILCSDSIELDGLEVFISFQFDNFRLIDVSLLFDSDAFDLLVEAYKRKFGVPPHSTETYPVTTRLGATYTNVTVRWMTTSGPFTISKYAGSVDKGVATLESPEYLEYLEREYRQDAEKIRREL